MYIVKLCINFFSVDKRCKQTMPAYFGFKTSEQRDLFMSIDI